LDALPGLTRMRIKKLFGATTIDDACTGGSFGQFEDYTLNVTSCTETAWYADNDADGFGNEDMMQMACSQPEGFVANGDDCDDANPNANPDATEVLYNGIDDNCDGSIDEGNQLTTQVRANQCGSTLANIYSSIFADAHPEASSYRFEVTKVGTGQVQYIE